MSILDKGFSKIPISSEKNFGFVFSLVFMIIAIYSFWYEMAIHFPALIISFIFFGLALLFPKILYIPNKIWFKFGLFLVAIILPITMGLIFYLTVYYFVQLINYSQ